MNYYNSETLLEQQQEIEKLKERNAALAAQVEALRAIDEQYKANEIGRFEYVRKTMGALMATPQHHLAEIRAQAGRDGFIAGRCYGMSEGCVQFMREQHEKSADQYAESIRQEKK